MPIRALVLDDEPKWREALQVLLGEEGYEVEVAESLAEARAKLASGVFHLVIIDIVLTGDVIATGLPTGLDLLGDIARLNQDPGTFCGPVIWTGNATRDAAIRALQEGAFEFREKPEDTIVVKRGHGGRGFDEQEILQACGRVLRRVLLGRNRLYEQAKYTLCFDVLPGQRMRAELTGPLGFNTEGDNVLDLDIDNYAGRADDLQFHFEVSNERERRRWRARAKDIGSDLYKALFAADGELMACLGNARTQSRSGQRLHMVFRGPRDILRVPLELLPGEVQDLIIESPLSRRISGVMNVLHRGIGRVFFDETTEIKVLLIGSNTRPPIPGVDEEIALLEKELPRLFKSRGFTCDLGVLHTDEASIDDVRRSLRDCRYHIVHYAGHGFHDEFSPNDSGIAFWEERNQGGKVKPMPVGVLSDLLMRSDTRLFYLSCCVGAKGASEASVKLTGGDFQGIAEGLIRTGIPSVLGYRWNVWDTEAKELALAFYEGLLTDLRLDLALHNARRKLWENDFYGETWASPILVSQGD